MIRCVCLMCALWCAGFVGAEEWNPKANEEAVVVSGKMRFTVLTSRMIRIQYSSTARFEDRATFAVVNRRLPVPQFTTETDGGYLVIRTADLTLRYKVGSQPRVTDKAPTNLSIAFQMNGQECVWYPGKTDNLNLKGTNRTLDTQWGDNMRYKLEDGLVSRAGWAIIDESPATKRGDGSTTFAFEDDSTGFPWWAQPVDKSATDWYFLGYGHDYKGCLADYIKVGGRVPLPPKYIFGYWYSRYWAYTQTEFMQIIRDVERNDIPMDVLIMDMDWHKSGWTGWSWDKQLISSPTTLIRYMHTHGLKTALNLHPADGVGNHEDYYAAMKKDLGYDASYTERIPWAIEDTVFARAFFKNIIRDHENEGVDFWWLDWQQHLLVSDALPLGETFWCNHVFFEDMKRNRPELRPVIYHRWGGLGNHRYPICFSGDCNAAWTTLGYQIYFTSTASNVCYDYWGHDLGGHQSGNNDPELLQRWLQFGVYSPIFRTHATNAAKLERRIWKYSNFEQLRETVRLRYRMFPYLYTAARETYETGVGMNRPLYYDWPEEDNAYRYEDEYMFGNDILVAPIYTPAEDGLSRRTIWLPEGLWWDVTHSALVNGGRTFSDSFTTDEFPVYYRPGSVIVNYPVQRTVETTPSEIILYVTPGADGTGRFYEDAGTNQDYETDKVANTYFHHHASADGAELRIAPRVGSYPGIPESRAWQVHFLGLKAAPESVSLNGNPLDPSTLEYNAATGELVVNIPATDCTMEQALQVKASFQQAGIDAGTSVAEYDGSVIPTGNSIYYVTGSALGGRIQPLELWDDGTYHFHGALQAGKLYIINTDAIRESTRYFGPKLQDSNIAASEVSCVSSRDPAAGGWAVLFGATNYRFTFNPSKMTLSGEVFTPWYEARIVGGCTSAEQQDQWHLEMGKEMIQSEANPYEWTWTGELKAYSDNEQPKRFKIVGQYGWTPKHLHPYRQDALITSAERVMYNYGNDYKWDIGDDGYYRITVDVFRETIKGEYLGKEVPDGFGQMLEETARVRVEGKQVRVQNCERSIIQLTSTDGRLCDTKQGTDVTLFAPQPGVYIVSVDGSYSHFTRKVVVE
ncbi:MAG: glycoside hydrolase family 31 protein [Bacteroidaceae bacterium]|nr:glycoside hydrolase family 31 protein [Bacteroidaceae bacterium]